jgi:hypothetical protein
MTDQLRGILRIATGMAALILIGDLVVDFRRPFSALMITDGLVTALLVPACLIQLRLRKAWIFPSLLSIAFALSAIRERVESRGSAVLMVGVYATCFCVCGLVAIVEISSSKRHRSTGRRLGEHGSEPPRAP